MPAQNVVSKLVVVIDREEQAVTLVQELNGKLTVKEQLQFLVQVVSDYRKQHQALNKSALVRM